MEQENRFKVLAWKLARVSELFQFHQEGLYDAGWGIKGHNRPWIVAHGDWEPGMRFIDVGAGYSDLPAYLIDSFDMEGWVADDFGISTGEELWSRWGDPFELKDKYPKVRYVFRNLGHPSSDLPEGSFDRLYSVSVLEHIPLGQIVAVLNHMGRLLKPGGIMLHTVDIPYPRTIDRPGLWGVAAMIARLLARRVLIALRAPGNFPYIHSVEGWATLLRDNFRIEGVMRGISSVRMILDHDILVEPPEVVYRFYPPNDAPKTYWPAASLTFILRKISE